MQVVFRAGLTVYFICCFFTVSSLFPFKADVFSLVQFLSSVSVNSHLSPVREAEGRGGKSCICEESLVLAAVCCCTLTSAASAKCINVFRSGLSSKFLHPTHLHLAVHNIFAWKKTTFPGWLLITGYDNSCYVNTALLVRWAVDTSNNWNFRN